MKRLVKILFIIIVCIICVNTCYAKFSTKIIGQGKTQLKVPIIILEKRETVLGEISQTNNLYETYFDIKNFSENMKAINEIDFEYNIKLIPSTANFPAQYTLINVDNNEEILLNKNLETDKIFIGNEKTVHRYKLVVKWFEINTSEKVDENLDVKVKINAKQIQKESL